MSIMYNDYVWRLEAPSVSVDLILGPDLEWVDEFNQTPISQSITRLVTGVLSIKETKHNDGTSITLQGKQDMNWITRGNAEVLKSLVQLPLLQMYLSYVHYNGSVFGTEKFRYPVIFNHSGGSPISLSHILGYSTFEPDLYYKVDALNFFNVTVGTSSVCAQSKLLSLSAINGTFTPGDSITQDNATGTGTVLSFSSPDLAVFVNSGVFETGKVVRVDVTNYAMVDSIV